MRTRIAVVLPVLTLAVALAVQQSAHAQRDRVFGQRGTPTTGAITEVTPTGITMTVGGTSRTFPLSEVQRVVFEGEPTEFTRAREAIQQGRYEDARQDLGKINVADLRRDLVRQDVEYYKAYVDAHLALTGGGDKSAALDALYSFVRTNAQSYHFLGAAQTLGDLAVALGRYDEAARFYGALAKAPWPEYKLRAAILEGRALQLAGQWEAARQRYDSVISSEVDTPEANRLKLLGSIGAAVCQAETGNPQQGIESLQAIIAKHDSSDTELFSRAYNALGRCYQRAGQPKEALLAYLHVDLLFFADGEAHAEALFHLSKLWSDLNKTDRAVRARSLLQSRYAGTTWARQL